MKPPSRYSFKHEVGIDVFEKYDNVGNRYSFLNIVCNGTCFQQAPVVVERGGQPKSQKCLEKFMNHWTAWAGWPAYAVTDRGLHKRGAPRKVSLRTDASFDRQP